MSDERFEGYARVTDVLSCLRDFSNVPPEILERAKERGDFVHELCHARLMGLYVAPTEHDGYIKSFDAWNTQINEQTLFCEERLFDDQLHMTGQIDLVCRIEGEWAVVDFKTPATPCWTWALQTAAYKVLIERQRGIQIERRITLMLKKDGKPPRVHQYTDDADERQFLALLELYWRGKKKHVETG